MEITREVLRNVRDDMNAMLIEVGKKHGLLLQAGRASFTSASATMKIEMAVPTGASGETGEHAKAAADWNAKCERFGLKREWLGKTFSSNGNDWTILGLRPTRHKYPVLCENSRGTVRVLTVQSVQAGFASVKPAVKPFRFDLDGYTIYPGKNVNTQTRNGIRTICVIYREGKRVAMLDDIPERIVTTVEVFGDDERQLMLQKARAAVKARKVSALGEKKPAESTLLSEYARYLSMAADEAMLEAAK